MAFTSSLQTRIKATKLYKNVINFAVEYYQKFRQFEQVIFGEFALTIQNDFC